ncbi:tyrosine-type recombinase/integrase [Actinomycetospora sp. OC33-EN08]|uniref:Tyrosine-type recombinase/integrase n=1 Tax=Actinomycetospora aurantiaca TaxID=3129233 RepID=A0ABU8MWP2_9PSEU
MSDETTFQVQFWKLRRTEGRRRPWGVRWVTAGKEHSESYTTKALAESFRSELVRAARSGEAFDVATGLPATTIRKRGVNTLLELAVAYVDHVWSSAPPNTRRAAVVNLGAIVPAFVRDLDHPPTPVELQRLLTTRLLPPPRREETLTPEERTAAAWLHRASRPVTDLADSLALGALLHALGTAADGRPVTSSTWDKRRAVLHRVAGYAVDTGVLATNPVTGRRAGTGRKSEGVDPRVVVNPAQARQLLAAATYVGARKSHERERGRRLYAFFACLYYGGLRPGEAQQLRDTDAKLPATGWGELLLSGSLTDVSGRHFADGVRDHTHRPLKRRRREDVRRVPIPPALVAILRAHLDTYGTAADGRLFPATLTGGPVPTAVYTRVWKQAREIGLTPSQAASPMASRPYDLRHAALSSWLNAGVPPTEVAERAGHTVAVLLSVYAKCLDGQRDTFNARISALLDPEA